MSEVFSLWIMMSLVSISSNFPFQVDLNTSPSASLNKEQESNVLIRKHWTLCFRCHHSSPPGSWTSSSPILHRIHSSLEVCVSSDYFSQFCVTLRPSYLFRLNPHLCTRISPFVYPRFKLKMQRGVKFEIKQWCWFGTHSRVPSTIVWIKHI